MLNMKAVDTKQLTLSSRFKFRCHKDIACFTRCCSKIDILLTPYDILRIKKRLKIDSAEFLLNYTRLDVDEKSSHPFVFLKMKEDEDKNCPFVTADGCSIYEDRPANCRYYPIGQASLKRLDEAINRVVTDEFYFFVKEPHCLGFEEDKDWTVKEWRDDQGVDVYDEMNRSWKEILFRKNLPGNALDEKKQKAFYMACYDLDWFKSFVFESPFLDKFDISEERLAKLKSDDTELMKLGIDYVKFILMMEQTLTLKQRP